MKQNLLLIACTSLALALSACTKNESTTTAPNTGTMEDTTSAPAEGMGTEGSSADEGMTEASPAPEGEGSGQVGSDMGAETGMSTSGSESSAHGSGSGIGTTQE